jgi:hypothetical protein
LVGPFDAISQKVETVFRSQALLKRTIAVLMAGICLQAVLAPVSLAQDKCIYPRLQILVPGEEPAPFTPTGKIGTPEDQRVGVPFRVRVRACTDDWELFEDVSHTIRLTSSDGEAQLPPDTPLQYGELFTWVVINSAGNFTFTAMDLTDSQHFSDTSSTVLATAPGIQVAHLAISEIAMNQTAGQATIVTIEARNAQGGLDTARSGQVELFQVTSLGQGVVSPETIELSNGQWTGTVTFYLADPADNPEGSVRLKATLPYHAVEGLSNYFNVAAGPYSRLLVIPPGQHWTPWILEGLHGTPEQQWADGPFGVDVYATDEYWNRVEVNDLVKLESGDSEANTPIIGPLAAGHRVFDVNMRSPGSWFLAVSDLDQDEIGSMVSQEVPVFYSHLQVLLPGESPAPGTVSGKTGQPVPQVAGIPFPVKVRACNAAFEPVPTDHVVVRLTSTDHTATLPWAAPMQNGELIAEMTFNSSGDFTVTAEDITGPEFYVTTTPAVPVTGSTGIVTGLEIEPLAVNQTAGQPVEVTIRAVDSDGAQVHTHAGSVSLEQWASLDGGSLEPGTVDLEGGQWTGSVTFHLADQSSQPDQPGSVQLHAVSSLDPAVAGTSNFFQVAPGDLQRLLIVLPGQYLVPATEGGLLGGAATQAAGFPFETDIYAADQYFNRVAVNHTVILESLDQSANTPIQTTLDNGHATVSVTLGSVGNWTITVRDLTDGSVNPMTTVPISVLGSSPVFVIEPVDGPVTAGQPVTVTIRTNSPEGELLEGFNGYAMLAADTGPETIQPVNIQFTAGVWTGEVTFFGAAQQTAFSCIDFASPPNVGTSDDFTVRPGDFAGLQVLLPGQENENGRDPGFTGQPIEQEAGIPFNVTVQAVDSWWNPVEDQVSVLSLDLTDPFALTPEHMQLENGRLEIEATFLRAGEHTIAAACDSSGIAPYTSSAFSVRPGPYTKIIALVPGEELLSGSELGKAGLPLDQSISYSFFMRVRATDSWWNPVTGVYDQIEVVCTDPLAEVVDSFSLEDGQAEVQVRLSTAGWQLMTLNNLSNPEIPAAHTQSRAIESGFHIEAEIHPEQVIAGQPFTLSVRVVNDAGAVMQDINGFAEVTALNATTGEPGQGDLLTASFQFYQGVRSITQTYTRSEPVVLVVTSPLGEDPGMTGVLSVSPGEPATLQFHETSDWVGGRHTTDINAKVADELGNGVPDVPVEFELMGGVGFLEIVNDITDAEGLAKARYTGDSQAGSGFIQVASAGLIASMQIFTSLMDPYDAPGSISNGPNPFHPGDGPTHIWYTLGQDARVTMQMFTLSGTLVFEQEFPAGEQGGAQGENQVDWDGRNGKGQYVASGGYILSVEAVSQGETIHKMRRRIAVVR